MQAIKMEFEITIVVSSPTYIDEIEYYWIDGDNIENRGTKKIDKNVTDTYNFSFESRVPYEFKGNSSFVVIVNNISAKKDIDVELLKVTNVKYLRDIENAFLLFIIKYEYVGLFIATIIATTVLPIATDFMVILAIYFELNLLLVVIVATLGSVIGAYTTFMIGRVFRAYAKRKISEEKLEKYDHMFQKYGVQVIFLGAFTPLPFDVIALAAGLLMVSSVKFVSITCCGRFLRYFLMSQYVDFALTSSGGEIDSGFMLYVTLGIGLLVVLTIVSSIIWERMSRKRHHN